MAANSIAKLAVMITADANPMQAGMALATKATQSFDNQIARSRDNMSRLSRQLISAGGGLGRFGGIVGGLGVAGGPVGLAAAGMVAATAAAGGFALKIANLNDAAQDLRIQSFRDYADAFEKLNGTKLTGHIGELQKTSEKWAELKQRADEYFFRPTGLSTGGIAKFMTDFIDRHTPGILRMTLASNRQGDKDRDAETKKLIKQAEHEFELGKKRNEQILETIRERGRLMEESARKAAAVFDSVKTPEEKFDDKLAELVNLSQEGFLSDSIFERAFRQAQQQYKDSTKQAASLMPTSVGAVERFTAAGFSAVQRVTESKKLEEHAKKTADNSVSIVKKLTEVVTELRTPRIGMDLKISNL